MNILIVQDQKPNGTSGGSSVAGTQMRDLNTVQVNTIAGASLAGNQITLPAGDYLITASAPGNVVGSHQVVLNNITTATLYHGANARVSGVAVTTDASISVGVTTAGAEVFQLDHFTGSAVTLTGLGHTSGNTGVEVYSTVTVQQL